MKAAENQESINQDGDALFQDQEARLKSLTAVCDGYSTMRRRFLGFYRRDVKKLKSKIHDKDIQLGNALAYHGDAIGDAKVYLEDGRDDEEIYIELYGLSVAEVVRLGMCTLDSNLLHLILILT